MSRIRHLALPETTRHLLAPHSLPPHLVRMRPPATGMLCHFATRWQVRCIRAIGNTSPPEPVYTGWRMVTGDLTLPPPRWLEQVPRNLHSHRANTLFLPLTSHPADAARSPYSPPGGETRWQGHLGTKNAYTDKSPGTAPTQTRTPFPHQPKSPGTTKTGIEAGPPEFYS
jgi:hypothetical protein